MTATHVNPGEPLTAEAWNDLVDAVNGIPDAIEAALLDEQAVRVKITNTGIDLSGVRVVAMKAGEGSIEAVRPIPPETELSLGGLKPGSYTLRVMAPGFKTKESSLEVPVNGSNPVEIALESMHAIMPDLFGLSLKAARTKLDELGISLLSLRDFVGRDYVPANPDTSVVNSPVLIQSPAARIPVTSGGAHLVIGVEVKQDGVIVVPSVIGMTLQQATDALAAVGLTIGNAKSMK